MMEFFEAIHAYPVTALLVSCYGLIAIGTAGGALKAALVARETIIAARENMAAQREIARATAMRDKP